MKSVGKLTFNQALIPSFMIYLLWYFGWAVFWLKLRQTTNELTFVQYLIKRCFLIYIFWPKSSNPNLLDCARKVQILYKYGPVMRAIWRQQYLPRSILLPKIHKTHIAQHHRSIFALLYVKCLWFKHIGLWVHILLDSP